jgi:hypothetical protein
LGRLLIFVLIILAAVLGVFYYLGGEQEQSAVEQPVALPDQG